jgi:DNA repair protein RecO (recombination protein O)
MLHKTRGIALNYIRYRESSIIAKIYTEEFGIQTYIVNGVRSAKSKTNRIALFQSLTLLDLVVYHKNREQTIHRIAEIKCHTPFRSLPFDFVKSSMAMFLTEILLKTLREEESNPPLFQFLTESVVHLDQIQDNFENFHLVTLVQLAFYLGFGTEDVKELEQQLTENLYPHPLSIEVRQTLQKTIERPHNEAINITKAQRKEMLDALVFFYKIHHEGMGDIKSLEVLREMMS